MLSQRGSNLTEMSSLETGNIEREWTREFHGSTYQITLSMTYGPSDSDHGGLPGNSMIGTALLRLEVELLDCENSHCSTSQGHVNERWYGEFTSQYIEEITHKAGNFKKCPVFVKMLSAAFTEVRSDHEKTDRSMTPSSTPFNPSSTPPLTQPLPLLYSPPSRNMTRSYSWISSLTVI